MSGGRKRYIVTRLKIAKDEVIFLKRMRWQTEVMNHELKNILGMDEYRVRCLEGARRHWEIIATVYLFLQYLRLKFGMIDLTPYRVLDEIWEEIRTLNLSKILFTVFEIRKF